MTIRTFLQKISLIMEAVFLIEVGMNITLLGNMMVSILKLLHEFGTINQEILYKIIVLTVPLINITAIFINYIIYKLYSNNKKYNFTMLASDAITLMIFYLQVYVLSSCYTIFSDKSILIINICFITVILVLFNIWNYALKWVLKNLGREGEDDATKLNEKKKITKDTYINYFLILYCIIMVVFCIKTSNNLIPFILQIPFLVFWLYKWVGHAKRNELKKILISDQLYSEE